MPFSVVVTSGTEASRLSPAAISTPKVSTSLTETSTMARLDQHLLAGGTSSWLTVDSNSLVVPGSARMMSAFKDSAAWMLATGVFASSPLWTRVVGVTRPLRSHPA